MDYPQTLAWLYAQLPMYQRVGSAAYKADLTNTLLLDKHLGHPHLDFPCLHVAGTNGKGSVSSMLASVLQEAGYKTGLYTSPHLKDFRERIKVNGNCIPEEDVVEFVKNHRYFFERHSLSFFEMTVGMAFDHFKRKKIDIAVVEVGMGGRLDSTNIISPLLSVITNIGFDHMQFLGDTLHKIAREKAGIIKKNTPVVIGEYQSEIFSVFEEIAYKLNAPLYKTDGVKSEDYSTDLKGLYQKFNLRTALKSLDVLALHSPFKMSESHKKKGLAHVCANTGLAGRWQRLGESPTLIADTAHNAEGLKYVLEQLESENAKQLHLILGFVKDKDLKTVLPLFPKTALYYFCKPDLPRGREAEETKAEFETLGIKGNTYASVKQALSAAREIADPNDVIFVGGSTFVVAEVL